VLDGPAAAALGRPADPPSPRRTWHLAATALKTWPCAKPLHTALAALRDLADTGVSLSPGDEVHIGLPVRPGRARSPRAGDVRPRVGC
jgi:hypothetical protein